ncbi:MAG: hypothetical protein WC976_06260 [Caldisericia bacterium]
MIIVIEIDKKSAGFGIDWFVKVKGLRLWFFAVHCIFGVVLKDIFVGGGKSENI